MSSSVVDSLHGRGGARAGKIGRASKALAGVVVAIGWLFTAVPGEAQSTSESPILTFNGTCSGTAGVMLAGFAVAIANGYDNILRVYGLEGGPPGQTVDLYALTEVNRLSLNNFSSFQGGARLGDRIYWVGSHSRGRRGQNKANRRRLVSVESKIVDGLELLEPIDQAYLRLSHDISESRELRSAYPERSIMLRYPKLERLAPDKQGLIIHGLAPSISGRGLYIALRNPLRRDRAPVFELRNPEELVTRRSTASFGPPILIGLDGRGIVSLDYSPAARSYFILAADPTKEENFALFRWSGRPNDWTPELVQTLSTPLQPHGLVVGRAANRALLLSDDGPVEHEVEQAECRYTLSESGGCPCHWLLDKGKRSFRGQWIPLPDPNAPPAS